MPQYKLQDYQCDVCGEISEQLIEVPIPNAVACPKCPHGTASKVLSPVSGKVRWNPFSSVEHE